MNPTLHRRDCNVADFANDEAAGVPLNRGYCEAGNIGIGNADGFLKLISKGAEPASQNHGDLRLMRSARANVARGVLGAFIKFRYC